MTEHKRHVSEQHSAATGELWYRGGCHGCPWLGPFRERKLDAVRDARQHSIDVTLHPDPTQTRDD